VGSGYRSRRRASSAVLLFVVFMHGRNNVANGV